MLALAPAHLGQKREQRDERSSCRTEARPALRPTVSIKRDSRADALCGVLVRPFDFAQQRQRRLGLPAVSARNEKHVPHLGKAAGQAAHGVGAHALTLRAIPFVILCEHVRH
jgi:hypothetical protein